jgi:hypothetical protein
MKQRLQETLSAAELQAAWAAAMHALGRHRRRRRPQSAPPCGHTLSPHNASGPCSHALIGVDGSTPGPSLTAKASPLGTLLSDAEAAELVAAFAARSPSLLSSEAAQLPSWAAASRMFDRQARGSRVQRLHVATLVEAILHDESRALTQVRAT